MRECIMRSFSILSHSRKEFLLKMGPNPFLPLSGTINSINSTGWIIEILLVIAQLQTLASMLLRKTLVFLVFSSSNRLNANQSSGVT